jgi:hypothetical protein
MRKELEQRVVERWPTWFNTGGDIRHTAMPWGFTHDDGWFDILWRLCEDLEPLVTEMERAGGPKFEVLQVKEKFGGLRIHVNHANDAIRQRSAKRWAAHSYFRHVHPRQRELFHLKFDYILTTSERPIQLGILRWRNSQEDLRVHVA